MRSSARSGFLVEVVLAIALQSAAARSPWRTVAGTGKSGFGGTTYEHSVQDFAVETRLSGPSGLALDAAYGRLYIADSLNHVIRSLDLQTGLLETVAGSGDPGMTDGDGQAVFAKLNRPTGLALDISSTGPVRTLYVSDTNNHRVRRVRIGLGEVYQAESHGSVGIPGAEARQVCPDAPDGALLSGTQFCEGSTGKGFVRYVHAVGDYIDFNVTASAGPGEYEARFRYADRYGMVHASGERRLRLYVNGVALTHALPFPPTGSPQAGRRDVFGWAAGPVMLSAGLNTLRLEVTGHGGPLIDHLYLVPPFREILTVAGTGLPEPPDDLLAQRLAVTSPLHSPQGLALDHVNQFLYIADSDNGCIRRLRLHTGFISTVVGGAQRSSSRDGEQAFGGKMFRPAGLVLDSAGEYLYISDSLQNRVRRVDLTNRLTVGGTIVTIGGFGMGLSPFEHMLRSPQGLALDEASGTLFVADRDNARIRAADIRDNTCHMDVVKSLDCAFEGVANDTCIELGCCFDPDCNTALNPDGRVVPGHQPEDVLTNVDGAERNPPISFVMGQKARCCFPRLRRLAVVEVLDSPQGIAWDASRRMLYVSQGRQHRVVRLSLDEGRCVGSSSESC